MEIHPSHSKKDLIEIIECFELNEIEDYRDMAKDDLRIELCEYIQGLEYLKPDREHFFISSVDDLIKYLINPTPKQLLTNQQMEKVSVITKNIIFYCRECSHSLCASNYDEIDEVIEDAIFISQYGDLPSVRRALRLLNDDDKIDVSIEPILTKRMRVKLKKLEELKRFNTGRLKVTHGPVVVSFD